MKIKPKRRLVYGPVRSRRLGLSLGIDIVPFKVCDFDCIYCQIGHTTKLTIERKPYVSAEEILKQVKSVVAEGVQIDFLTFSGSGEPTLNSQLGKIIEGLKAFTRLPIAVITNGSLLFRPDVRQDLHNVDVVLPTLCTARDESLRKINRMHESLKIETIIAGQVDFRKEFKGKIWLEIMLIEGFNDRPEELAALKAAVARIRPDKVHLNTVVRPPSESFARPLTGEELQKICAFFGEGCEPIAEFDRGQPQKEYQDQDRSILSLITRRPATREDIAGGLGLEPGQVAESLDRLVGEGKIFSVEHDGRTYYKAS